VGALGRLGGRVQILNDQEFELVEEGIEIRIRPAI